LRRISIIKIQDHFGSVPTQIKFIHKSIATVATSFQGSFSQKRSKRKGIEARCKIWQKSIQTVQQVKINFFENLLLLKSKSAKLIKVR
jgi:hypothetical protein